MKMDDPTPSQMKYRDRVFTSSDAVLQS